MEKQIINEVPNGEIDKANSTFEHIVFKKPEDVVIRWNEEFLGVEINADGEHFVIDANHPSFKCSWDDAMRYFGSCIMWKLPTIRQLQIIAKHKDKINDVIRENNGYEIEGWLWSCEEEDEFCAYFVMMYNGNTDYDGKVSGLVCVRAVSAL